MYSIFKKKEEKSTKQLLQEASSDILTHFTEVVDNLEEVNSHIDEHIGEKNEEIEEYEKAITECKTDISDLEATKLKNAGVAKKIKEFLS